MVFRNTIQIGVGCEESMLKADGDILLATPDNQLLIHDGNVFVNGVIRGTFDADAVQAIRQAMDSISGRLSPEAVQA